MYMKWRFGKIKKVVVVDDEPEVLGSLLSVSFCSFLPFPVCTARH